MNIRKSEQRGVTKIDWLDSRHSFSFGNYYDPNNMGFGALRVINDDKVKPSAGFSTHPHKDMEIITFVMEGALEHKDSLGTGSVIVPGDVQRMSAGTGILHSEFNPLSDKPVHLLQIWVLPAKNGIKPEYEQKNFTEKRMPGAMTMLVSPDGRGGTIMIHQDVFIHVLDLQPGKEHTYTIAEGRMVWAQVATGAGNVNGSVISQGDGVAARQEKSLQFSGGNAEILVFDLPSV